MQVTIDGRDYVPATDSFRLTDEHFEAVAKCESSFDLIRWAHDQQASVAEMLAYARAIDIVLPVPTPVAKKTTKKPEPLTTDHLKPKAALFE